MPEKLTKDKAFDELVEFIHSHDKEPAINAELVLQRIRTKTDVLCRRLEYENEA